MGGLWVDYQRNAAGGLVVGSPKNQVTNIPGLYALGECDYQYHGANRLGANSLLSCIFSGLIVAPGIESYLKTVKGGSGDPANQSLVERERRRHEQDHKSLLQRSGGGENPYLIHQELGEVMTKASTVVRFNNQLSAAYDTVVGLSERVKRCSLSDTGNWTNQNVVFTKALRDMLPVALTILKGALLRDESRGAHYKPDFSLGSLTATDPADRRRQAEEWVDHFEANNRRFLKSTIAKWNGTQPDITYEDVDTSLIPPRPRLYGLVGADLITEVYKQRQQQGQGTSGDGNGATKSTATPAPALK
jgi:succinate dehydrogenase / fumarate reductase flavoprotein subunit